MVTLPEALEGAARKRRAKVALGVGKEKEKIMKAADVAGEFVDVVIGGADILDMLASGEVEAAVRGTLSSSEVMPELRKRYPGFLARASIMEVAGYSFLLSPVGIDEGRSWQERAAIAWEGARLLSALGIKAKVGVLGGGRPEDRGRDPWVDRTLDEAELIVGELGGNARNYSILLEEALGEGANVIIPPSGVIGNYLFRSLVLVAGGRSHGAPALGLEKVFVDTSRSNTEEGYVRAMRTAAALANLLV